MHIITDIGGSIGGQSGGLRFFCIQAVGIVPEDSLEAAYKQVLAVEASESARL